MNLWTMDKTRYGEGTGFTNSHAVRFLFFLRRSASGRNIVSRLILKSMSRRYGLEISRNTAIGGGLYLGHAYGITVNPEARIGENCNLHKGVTLGRENRGSRKGAPTLGDRVWVGVNATVVGAVNIGSDVLIAPNSYVNRDVPSHSVVFGNPCVIKPREDATEGYINRLAGAGARP